MARSYHSEERILRAVRDLLLQQGPRGVTTSAVSALSGAPTGSLYYRFGSMPVMVAELWVRTTRDFHADVEAATRSAEPGMDRAMATVGAIIDFAARRPADARLMLTANRGGLEDDPSLPPELADSLRSLDAPIDALARQLARELFGRATPMALDKIHIGVFGVVYTTLRQALTRGRDPRDLRRVLEDAAKAVLVGTILLG